MLRAGVNTLTGFSPLSPELHAGDVAELGRHGDGTAWIHRSALEHLGLPQDLQAALGILPAELARAGVPHPWVDRAIAAGYTVNPPGLAPWIVVRGPTGWRVDLAVPAYDDAGELGDLDPEELRAALDLYRAAVGVAYRRSPGATGTDLLRRLRRRRPLGPSAPPPPALNGAAETDLRWIRPLTPEERLRPWIHAYDANARYLASCASVELGDGEPEHLIPKRVTLDFDRRLPGYWRAGVWPAPDELTAAAIGPGPWYTTPTLELVDQLGLLGTIEEAYVWPSHGRLLEPFYRALRDARAALLPLPAPAPQAALRLIKRTYAHTIGGFAGHWREPGDELYRPDWRHAIIANARANLYRRIIRAAAEDGAPFAVDVDAVWIASATEAHGGRAGAALGLGDGPGSFRHVGSAPMGRLDRSILARSWTAGLPWRHLREIVR